MDVNKNKIVNHVINVTGVTKEQLMSNSRKQNIVISRYICMYFFLEYQKCSTASAGGYFNKDHATAIHARKVIRNRIEKINGKIPDKEVFEKIKNIRELIEKKPYEKTNTPPIFRRKVQAKKVQAMRYRIHASKSATRRLFVAMCS